MQFSKQEGRYYFLFSRIEQSKKKNSEYEYTHPKCNLEVAYNMQIDSANERECSTKLSTMIGSIQLLEFLGDILKLPSGVVQ